MIHARYPVLRAAVNPGTFLAAVGADSPGKNELDPTLFVGAKVVGDLLKQTVEVGETQNPIRAGLLTLQDLHGELDDLLVGRLPAAP